MRFRLPIVCARVKTAVGTPVRQPENPFPHPMVGWALLFAKMLAIQQWLVTNCSPCGAGAMIRQPEKHPRVGCRGLSLLVVGGETPVLAKNKPCLKAA